MRFFCFIFTLLFSMQAFAFSPTDLRFFGKESPVLMYLFTSLTCPHCADFHKKILPRLKKEFAETGKVQLIIVDMVTAGNGLTATQTLRCLDATAADKFEDDLYDNQSKWMRKEPPFARKVIRDYASRQGMKPEQFNLCTTDKELERSIIEQQANLARLYGITGTPTLVLRNGTTVHKWSGVDTKIFKELKEALQQ